MCRSDTNGLSDTLNLRKIIMKIKIISLILLCLCSCSKPRKHEFESIGKVKNVEAIVTSWNEAQKSKITTDKMVVFVRGYPSLPLDVECFSDGTYLSWIGQHSNEESYEITRR